MEKGLPEFLHPWTAIDILSRVFSLILSKHYFFARGFNYIFPAEIMKLLKKLSSLSVSLTAYIPGSHFTYLLEMRFTDFFLKETNILANRVRFQLSDGLTITQLSVHTVKFTQQT